ncbi:hypothetical protein, partial [Bradyrhizobium elkanii]|uniref:hypothetical protein n=1 Tax=Bradyrhizobium elkanii TaxID=29448 RepID=UPI001AEEC1E7
RVATPPPGTPRRLEVQWPPKAPTKSEKSKKSRSPTWGLEAAPVMNMKISHYNSPGENLHRFAAEEAF